MLGPFSNNCLEHFWTTFGAILGPFWDQIGSRGVRMRPRRPSRASKYPKPPFTITLKTVSFCLRFWGSKAVQDSLGRPKKAPKRHHRSDFYNFLEYFWSRFWFYFSGPKSGPKRDPKSHQKWNQFWNSSLRLSEVALTPKPAFCEAVRKVPGG